MSQETTGSRKQQEISAPFRAKSAGVSLVIILVIGLYYVASLFSLLPSNEAVPDGALNLVIATVILIIVFEIALQIVLFIGAGQIEERTERDDAIAAKASRNAYSVLAVGAFATFASMFAGFTPFEMGSILLLTFLLAEIARFASQIVYYQRSA